MSTTVTEISGADLEQKAADVLARAFDALPEDAVPRSDHADAIRQLAQVWSTIVMANMNVNANT